jgi:hypothetical protein
VASIIDPVDDPLDNPDIMDTDRVIILLKRKEEQLRGVDIQKTELGYLFLIINLRRIFPCVIAKDHFFKIVHKARPDAYGLIANHSSMNVEAPYKLV